MKRLLILLAAATLVGCDLNTGPANNPSNPATETFATSLGVDLSTMTETAAGDYYKDLTVGTGAAINGDAYVTLTYTAYLKDGTEFESGSIPTAGVTQQELAANPDDPNQPGLILGLQDALQGMKVGGTRLIVVPSEYGYGNSSITGSNGVTVPPNSTLIFNITLSGVAPVL